MSETIENVPAQLFQSPREENNFQSAKEINFYKNK
jgi:hypothetical protein